MEEEGESWQADHFNQRHISARNGGKGSSRKGGAGNKSVFLASSSYGLYEVACPALAKVALGPLITTGATTSSMSPMVDSPLSASFGSGIDGSFPSSPGGSNTPRRAKKGRGSNRRESKEDRIMEAAAARNVGEARFEIHGDVEGEGNEGALMCSFDWGGVVHGVAVLAGSRRLISRVVAELEGEEDDSEDRRSEDFEAQSVTSTADGYGSDEEETPMTNDIEQADERERRKIAAFEKNSFRAPKFWMRWRGYVSADGGAASDQLQRSKSGRSVEVNTGYLVFSGNDCSRFSGTFTCQTLGWKNIKITGAKLVSKARECPMEWTDVIASGSGR